MLVGLSGGPDSWALLLVLKKVAARRGFTFCAGCVDHGMREESSAEATRVARACRALGVACDVLRADVAGRRTRHVSWQEAARAARLDSLERHAARVGANRIALGHHADDQAETILFRILRGTGVAGLAGIPYRRGPFVRPLLDVRRSEIVRFVARQDIPVITDPSNEDRRYTRVRLRLDVLPFLARENPRVVEALLGLGGEARGRKGPSIEDLPSGPAGLHLPPGTRADLQRLAAEGRGTRRLSVKGGEIEIAYGRVRFVPGRSMWADEPPPAQSIEGPGVVAVDGCQGVLHLRLIRDIQRIEEPQDGLGPFALFDAHVLRWPLQARRWRRGDRMRLRGGRGSRKLSDLFVDAKIPRGERGRLPVLLAGDGTILFVPGLRPSERAAPDRATKVALAVEFKKAP